MSNRHDRRRQKNGAERVFSPDEVGKVLTRRGDDIPLDPNSTIDLIEESEKLGGGTPSFNTRKADPMRPFRIPLTPDKERIAKETAQEIMRNMDGLEPESRRILYEEIMTGKLEVTEGVVNTGEERVFLDAVAKYLPPFKPESPEFRVAGEVAKVLEGLPQHKRQPMIDALLSGSAKVTALGQVPHSTALDSTKLQNAIKNLAPHRQDRVSAAFSMFDGATAHEIVKPMIDATLIESRAKRKIINSRIDGLDREGVVLEELAKVITDIRLQRVTESCFHKAVDAWRSGQSILPFNFGQPPADVRALYDNLPNLGVFLLQHDWAGAFKTAKDFEGGEIRMPFDETVLETRLSGHRVCVSMGGQRDDAYFAMVHFESTVGWAMIGWYTVNPATLEFSTKGPSLASPILKVVLDQARAISIALEAELVASEVVRAPHRLNQKRERAGKLPLYDYHIVSLANRKKYQPREPLPGDLEEDEKIRKRLHFVRGHWAHYKNSKTWRRWHFRGDPDLGYVDKEYRL